jgi:hypothetical protein
VTAEAFTDALPPPLRVIDGGKRDIATSFLFFHFFPWVFFTWLFFAYVANQSTTVYCLATLATKSFYYSPFRHLFICFFFTSGVSFSFKSGDKK